MKLILLAFSFSIFFSLLYAQPGTLDKTFGNRGKVFTPNTGIGQTLLLRKDGKIMMVGYGNIVRYLSDGKVDLSFGVNGIAHSYIKEGKGNIVAALQTDNKILVCGSRGSFDSGYVIGRYLEDGALDSSFGNNGLADSTIDSTQLLAEVIAVQNDGKIVVAGNVRSFKGHGYSSVDKIGVVRYKSNGSIDKTFGKDGIFYFTIAQPVNQCYALILQTDGKIVLGGRASKPSNNFFLTRLTTNGSLDNSFGTEGTVFTDFCSGEDEVTAIAQQNDGKLVVCGYVSCNSSLDFAIVRYSTNGFLDDSFGTNGKVIYDYNNTYDSPKSIAITKNGKVIVAGYTTTYDGYTKGDFLIVQYRENGNTDRFFGNKGQVITNFYKYDSKAYTMLVQPDGKFIVGGYANDRSYPGYAIARYNNENYIINLHKPVIDSDHAYSIAPNPVNTSSTIRGLPVSCKATIKVIDVFGNICLTAVTRSSTYTLNIQKLKSGVYYVEVITGNKMQTIKLLKQ